MQNKIDFITDSKNAVELKIKNENEMLTTQTKSIMGK